MKKIVFTFFSILIISIISLAIYWNLPFEITRKSDIKFGNELIKNIETYKIENNNLPKNGDWKTLEKLGFKIEILGTKPDYETNQNGEFEIVFLEGFDGPYLMWNSKEKKWKIDFPTIFTQTNKNENKTNLKTVNGKTIIFLRPSEEKFETLKNENGIYEVDSDFGFAITRTIDFLKANPNYKSIKNEIITDRYIEITDCNNCPKTIDRDSIYYGLILTEPNKAVKIIHNVQTLNYENEIEEYFN